MFWRLHSAIFGTQIHEAFDFLTKLGDDIQIVTGSSLAIDPVP